MHITFFHVLEGNNLTLGKKPNLKQKFQVRIGQIRSPKKLRTPRVWYFLYQEIVMHIIFVHVLQGYYLTIAKKPSLKHKNFILKFWVRIGQIKSS